MANEARDLARRNRDWIFNRGDQLFDESDYDYKSQWDRSTRYGDAAGDYYRRMAEGGGFSDDEMSDIMGYGDRGGIPGLARLSGMTGEEAASNYLTGDEARGMVGDPFKYLHSDTMGQYMTEGHQAQDRAVDRQRSDLRRAIDPSRLRPGQSDLDSLRVSGRYGDAVGSTLSRGRGDMEGNLSRFEESINDPTLGLDANFSSEYKLSPEQQQELVNDATRDVTVANEAQMQDLDRRSQASGLGSLGALSRRARYGRLAGQDATAAAAKARIAASAEAARRLRDAEGMRLSAEQFRSGQRGRVADIGQRSAEFLTDAGLGAERDLEDARFRGEREALNTRLGSERDISDRQLQAATEAGRADIANRTGQTQTALRTVADVRDAELGAENRQANRYGQVALNRQATQQSNNQENYNRGMATNQAMSNRYGSVYSNRQDQRAAGARGLTQQQQISSDDKNQAANRRMQGYGMTGGLGNESTQTIGQVQNQPGIGSRIFNGILGAAGTAATLWEEGGVSYKPTTAIVGEAGPEMIMPVDKPYKIPVIPGQMRMGNRYGAISKVRNALPKVADIAQSFQQGYDNPGTVINRPTRVRLDRGEAVVPFKPKAKARPGVMPLPRYGGAYAPVSA